MMLSLVHGFWLLVGITVSRLFNCRDLRYHATTQRRNVSVFASSARKALNHLTFWGTRIFSFESVWTWGPLGAWRTFNEFGVGSTIKRITACLRPASRILLAGRNYGCSVIQLTGHVVSRDDAKAQRLGLCELRAKKIRVRP